MGLREGSLYIFICRYTFICFLPSLISANNSSIDPERSVCCSNKTCNFCGVKGHKESQCFKKNPEKAPAWWKAKHDKVESAMPSVEVSLTSFADYDIFGVNVTALPAEKGNTLDILCDNNVWSCDTGASMHVMEQQVHKEYA